MRLMKIATGTLFEDMTKRRGGELQCDVIFSRFENEVYLIDIRTSCFGAAKLCSDEEAATIRRMAVHDPVTKKDLPVGAGTKAPANSTILVGTPNGIDIFQCEVLELGSVDTAQRMRVQGFSRKLRRCGEVCCMLGVVVVFLLFPIILAIETWALRRGSDEEWARFRRMGYRCGVCNNTDWCC